jgi:hypothetical protein
MSTQTVIASNTIEKVLGFETLLLLLLLLLLLTATELSLGVSTDKRSKKTYI